MYAWEHTILLAIYYWYISLLWLIYRYRMQEVWLIPPIVVASLPTPPRYAQIYHKDCRLLYSTLTLSFCRWYICYSYIHPLSLWLKRLFTDSFMFNWCNEVYQSWLVVNNMLYPTHLLAGIISMFLLCLWRINTYLGRALSKTDDTYLTIEFLPYVWCFNKSVKRTVNWDSTDDNDCQQV